MKYLVYQSTAIGLYFPVIPEVVTIAVYQLGRVWGQVLEMALVVGLLEMIPLQHVPDLASLSRYEEERILLLNDTIRAKCIGPAGVENHELTCMDCCSTTRKMSADA